MSIRRVAENVLLTARKYAPEILTGMGVVSFGATIIFTVKGAKKSTKITEHLHEDIEYGKLKYEDSKNVDEDFVDESFVPFTRADLAKNTIQAYGYAAKELTKTYWPAMLCGTVSICSFLTATKILRARNTALVAAYTMLDISYREYRERVRAKYGEDEDRQFLHGFEMKEIELQELDEEGNAKKEIILSSSPLEAPFTAKFDASAREWRPDMNANRVFLYQQQQWANQLLKRRGHVFLNEILDGLGIDRTPYGQLVGWKITSDGEIGDNYIDFGIYDEVNLPVDKTLTGLGTEENAEHGRENLVNRISEVATLYLCFNVDGIIFDRI